MLGSQINPMPQVPWTFGPGGGPKKTKGKIKIAVIYTPTSGVSRAIILKGIGLFLASAAAVELIGFIRDLVTPRPQTKEVEQQVERWLKERYGDVLKPRISPRSNGKRPAPKGKKEPFAVPYPNVDVERTLDKVFPVPKVAKRTQEDPDQEDIAEWFERRFNASIVRFQRL